jgi:phospholipid/cholesterol/gamma-HCH transport system permease protein
MRHFFGKIGLGTTRFINRIVFLVGLGGVVLRMALSPRRFTRPVREVLARQILFTGLEALRFLAVVALMAGVLVVVQMQVLLKSAGQTGLLGTILVGVIIREAAPLVTNFIVIARSGTAISTELANMRVSGEVDVLEALGIEPVQYLVLPRVLGVCLSVFCLTVAFIVLSLTSGYLCGQLIRVSAAPALSFVRNVLEAITPADLYNLVTKIFVTSFLTGVICTAQGLSIAGTVTEVPQAATRAMEYSIASLFVVSAVITVITYM